MKKAVAVLLALGILLTMLGSGFAEGTLYDQDIHFPGHTFGETLA